jgi:hypothetical protein
MRIECRSNNVGGTSFQNLSVIIDRPPDAGESVAKRISSLSATSSLSLAVTVGWACAAGADPRMLTSKVTTTTVARRFTS